MLNLLPDVEASQQLFLDSEGSVSQNTSEMQACKECQNLCPCTNRSDMGASVEDVAVGGTDGNSVNAQGDQGGQVLRIGTLDDIFYDFESTTSQVSPSDTSKYPLPVSSPPLDLNTGHHEYLYFDTTDSIV